MTIFLIIIGLIIFYNLISRLSKSKTYQNTKNINFYPTITIRKPSRKVSRRCKISLPKNLELSEEFTNAFNLIENSNDCIFITGKAGTGKSTLLQYFKEKTKKNVVVLAPTGVAAVNVNGQTIHSFFKFPPRLIQRENIRRRRNREIIRKINTVIVDEVSMVRADLMDGIDYALRINRDQMGIPFGGVQVVFFGDLFQLPPVVEREVREILERKYESPYFFSANVFNNIKLKYIELSKIYRQSDSEFIELLNRIRNKNYKEDDLDFLNERVNEKIPDDSNHCITLTTTNNGANIINENHLAKLGNKKYKYQAKIFGEFNESSYPTEFCLKLKKDAQVMLIKNDPDKRWVNGTIGQIADLSDNYVKVSVDNNVYEIPRVMWEKIEYKYNEEEKKIEEEIIGTFEQYPIKLAWAITIHKSQGQTFGNVTIDLEGGAFVHGQVYVALSRCTNLRGILLKRPVVHNDIIFDERIYKFREKLLKC